MTKAKSRTRVAFNRYLITCIACISAVLSGCATNAIQNPRGEFQLVIVIDGLRPDFITSELMPNLHTFGRQGFTGTNHHSVFPTVTRVNAASIATGSYPRTHGLIDNTVFYPEIDPRRGLLTSEVANLDRIEEATGGALLTAPGLGEILDAAGRQILVVSSGSTGAALLLNHKISGAGIINTGMIRPAELEERVLEKFGPEPAAAKPNIARTRRVIDAWIEFGLDAARPPDLTLMWITDPDATEHTFGIGSPETNAALKHVDDEFGRIIEALYERGLLRRTNIFVTSDHGFSTQASEQFVGQSGGSGLKKLLIQNGFKKSNYSEDVVVVDGAIYLGEPDRDKVRRIAEMLFVTPWVGAVLTEKRMETHPEGFVLGAMSMTATYMDHERAPDLYVDPSWTSGENEFGFPGMTAKGGIAGHGSTSPFDIGIPMIGGGPDIKRARRSDVPTGNVDFAPTVLHLLRIPIPVAMDGRVMTEALRGGPKPEEVEVLRRTHYSIWEGKDGRRRTSLSESTVNGTDYFNFTRVEQLD